MSHVTPADENVRVPVQNDELQRPRPPHLRSERPVKPPEDPTIRVEGGGVPVRKLEPRHDGQRPVAREDRSVSHAKVHLMSDAQRLDVHGGVSDPGARHGEVQRVAGSHDLDTGLRPPELRLAHDLGQREIPFRQGDALAVERARQEHGASRMGCAGKLARCA